jgi:head-tail adaptor
MSVKSQRTIRRNLSGSSRIDLDAGMFKVPVVIQVFTKPQDTSDGYDIDTAWVSVLETRAQINEVSAREGLIEIEMSDLRWLSVVIRYPWGITLLPEMRILVGAYGDQFFIRDIRDPDYSRRILLLFCSQERRVPATNAS